MRRMPARAGGLAASWRAGVRTGVLASAGLLGGCGVFGSSPTSLVAEITVDKGTNPNLEGQPSPVVVRLDLLRAKEAYNAAEFTPLYTQSKTVLAQDLVSSQEMELRPGDTRTVEIKDAKDATVLGILVAYRNIEPAKWRVTYDLALKDNSNVNVRVGIGAVEAEKKRRGFFSLW